MDKTPHAWCVGASLQATFDSRNRNGESNEMHMVLCPKDDWTGNGRGKIGNTCKTCCDGVNTKAATVGSKLLADVDLKKCTWLKCCYGRRPYGGTESLPWSMRCEQQKKLLSAEERSQLTAASATASAEKSEKKKAARSRTSSAKDGSKEDAATSSSDAIADGSSAAPGVATVSGGKRDSSGFEKPAMTRKKKKKVRSSRRSSPICFDQNPARARAVAAHRTRARWLTVLVPSLT